MKRSNQKIFFFEKNPYHKEIISKVSSSDFNSNSFEKNFREKTLFIMIELIQQISILNEDNVINEYSPTTQDIFIYLNTLDSQNEFVLLNNKTLDRYLDETKSGLQSKDSKKDLVKTVFGSTREKVNNMNKHFDIEENSNPFLELPHYINKKESFSIKKKMEILCVLSPMSKSALEFEMSNLETKFLSQNEINSLKHKDLLKEAFNIFELNYSLQESKSAQTLFYLFSLKLQFHHQIRAFFGIEHNSLQNFLTLGETSKHNLFFQKIDMKGIGSLLCFLKNIFIQRSENRKFSRDLMNIIKECLAEYFK